MSEKMQIVTVREVAAFLRLKESTVCTLVSRGKLPGVKLGKSWRFDMSKIERLLAGTQHIGKDRWDGDQGDTENKEEKYG
jgi:excisionase family DNA binding protein